MAGNFTTFAAKWAKAMQSAGTAYSEGIDTVRESPTDKAAQKESEYIAGVQAAVSSGKWAAKLRSVSLTEWKDKAKNKGAQRISAGAKAAESKVAKFWQVWGPVQENIMQTVRALPNATFQDRINRMVANAQAAHDAAESMYR